MKRILEQLFIFFAFAVSANAQSVVTVNATLTTDTVKQQFSDIKQALRYVERHWKDNKRTEIRIAPGVYWIDNPDDNRILRPTRGGIPYGMEITMSNVTFAGTGESPEDVVLASQRGQTQGADGNFTMLHITGSDIVARNITFGNYCNVDLVYPRNPALNRKKKADAIVQAQLVICDGDRYLIDNCRFISRLNLCPFAGARHALFRNCYFESTDDALTGTGVYVDCRFTFYSGKPFYSTSRQGAVMVNCDIHSKVHGQQYLSKVPSPFFVIDCRFTSDDKDLKIDWTSVPGEMLRCYHSGNTLNGKPLAIGAKPNSVDMTGKPVLSEFRNRLAALLTSQDPAAELQYLPTPLYLDTPELTTEADVEQPEHHYLTTRALDGREAVTHLSIIPSLLPTPKVVKPLRLKAKGNTVTATYELALDGHQDASTLLWYRTKGTDSVLVQVGGTTYIKPTFSAPLKDGSINEWDVACKLIPNSNRSTRERQRTIYEYRQERVIPGFWSYDTYKPKDLAEYDWQPDPRSSGWAWGKGMDGAANSEGLLQTSKGARMMFTPAELTTGDMSVTILCDPCKSAGQGFGSATGQYMDICLKMDNATLTGYALRLRRTPYLDKAVEALLVEYTNGMTRELTSPVVTTAFRSGCAISASIKGNQMTATVANSNEAYPSVTLTANVATSTNGGFIIQHTGSTGASATVIKDVKISR